MVSAPGAGAAGVHAGRRARVLELLQKSLGWVPDEQYARFFGWKHRDSPFGKLAGVAGHRRRTDRWVPDVHALGVRDRRRPVRAVRAVDTATHPDFQGAGSLLGLTLGALEELRSDGVAFVFNTPNERSRPGYLKMGWQTGWPAPGTGPDPFGDGAGQAGPRPDSSRRVVATVLVPVARSRCARGSAGGRDVAVAGFTWTACEPGCPPYLAWRYGFPTLATGRCPADDAHLGRLGDLPSPPAGRGPGGNDLRGAGPRRGSLGHPHLLRRALRDSGADYAVRLAAVARRGPDSSPCRAGSDA